jgi:hypothetical protein
MYTKHGLEDILAIADIIDGKVKARNEDPRSPAHLIFRNDPHV